MSEPYKLCEKLIKDIAKEMAGGASITDACLLCGVSRPVYYLWRKKAKEEPEDSQSIYRQFLDAMEVAEAGFKRTHLARIASASKGKTEGQWQASAWLLERKFPAEFSRREQVALTDKIDEFVKAFDEIKGSDAPQQETA